MDFQKISLQSATPVNHPVFLALYNELKHLRTNKAAILDWNKLHIYCERLFIQHGYDLQTGSWFCLINAHCKGWTGLAVALEQWMKASEYFTSMARNEEAYSESLNWLNEHLSGLIFMLPVRTGYKVAMIRIERSLGLLLNDPGVAFSYPMLNGSYHYLQNRTGRSYTEIESLPIFKKFVSVPQPVEIVINQPLDSFSDYIESKSFLNTRKLTDNKGSWLIGLIVGFILLLLAGSGWLTFARKASQLQEVHHTLGELQKYVSERNKNNGHLSDSQKNELSDILYHQPGWIIYMPEAQRLLRTVGSLAHDIDKVDTWQSIKRQLEEFEKNLLDSEIGNRKNLTISEIKTYIYQLKSSMNEIDTSLEILSRSGHDDGELFKEKLKLLLDKSK